MSKRSAMVTLTRWVLGHKKLVVALWIALAIAGVAAVGSAGKSFDEQSFLQRYTPRRARSIWSQVNREHVHRLTGAGRMQPAGQRQVDAARADGRWDAAYAPMRSASAASIPDDLRTAIAANPRAEKTFRSLGRQNLFSLTFRTNNMKTPDGRARKIASLVAMLARGETIVPERIPRQKAKG